jgi:cytochrome c-type biogenesis protein CcsB
MRKQNFIFHFFSIVSIISSFSLTAEASPEPRAGWDFQSFASVPVQVGGRIKPFDSFARDTVLTLTGKRIYNGWDPVELMLSWITSPKAWENEPFIFVSRKDVKRQLGLPEDQARFSPKELLDQSSLIDYANSSAGKSSGMSGQATPIAKTTRPEPRNEEMKRVIDRASLFRAIVLGMAWQVVPAVQKDAPWESLHLDVTANGSAGTASTSGVKEAYFQVFSAYLSSDQTRFENGSATLRSLVAKATPSWSEWDDRINNLELAYNRLHPYQVAWIIYLVAALLFGLAGWLGTARKEAPPLKAGKKSVTDRMTSLAIGLTILGFLFHVGGMVVRSIISGRPPVTNMYESVIWVSFGVFVFAFILFVRLKNTTLLAVASTLGVVGLIAADAAPTVMDPGIHPLVPVLRSNMWLTIHVLTITISYAAFALTMGIGNLTLFQYLRGVDQTDDGRKKIIVLNGLTYRAMQFGVVLLAAGTILGGVWADYSWGRFWGWDPKEVWALIALMGYIIILHARYTGWMQQFGYAAWTVIAYSLVIMAWYGVNFVLGVGLHSYGFSSGGQSTVAILVGAQAIYVGLVAVTRRKLVKKKAA